MVRLYGNAPYKIVLVHGGPGAIGTLKGFAIPDWALLGSVVSGTFLQRNILS